MSPHLSNLKQHDIELSRRLWNNLRSHGFDPIPLPPPISQGHGIPPTTHAVPIDMDIDEDAEEMDVDSPPSPTMPTSPPPSPSSPTADPASSPPERTLTPAQLVASLHLRQREKNAGSNAKTGLKAKCLRGGHLSLEGRKEMVKSRFHNWLWWSHSGYE